MHRLCTLLGMPQRRFASIHVVGTNGKTSVTRMTAALLEAGGVSAGAYTSPHFLDWRERIQIRGEPISARALTDALERAEQAATAADRAAAEQGPVTQYELLTAAAFLAFAEARLDYGVIEAGLGGRLDATNVIPSKLTVLASVGLDHTEWLGETLPEIAAEKLAVLRDHSGLVCGAVPEELLPVIADAAERHHVEAIHATGGPGYQAQNLAVATAAAEFALGGSAAVREHARESFELLGSVPGRAQVEAGAPPLVFDAAHNPDGARALAELLPDLVARSRLEGPPRARPGPREVVCCLAVLEGKDAEGIVGALAPACAAFVCTEVPERQMRHSGRPDARSIAAERLARFCRQAGSEAEAVPDTLAAWRRARELARERGGVALAAGSHYLLKSLWTERRAESC